MVAGWEPLRTVNFALEKKPVRCSTPLASRACDNGRRGGRSSGRTRGRHVLRHRGGKDEGENARNQLALSVQVKSPSARCVIALKFLGAKAAVLRLTSSQSKLEA